MQRSSGILLHPTALPGRQGIGTLGAEAHQFLNLLENAGQTIWQILPIGPTGYGLSPYNALSAFAGNPLLIDLEALVRQGDLPATDLSDMRYPEGSISMPALRQKTALLKKAGQTFLKQASPTRRAKFDMFCRNQSVWLDDFSFFMALREHFDERTWLSWPDELCHRDPTALKNWRDRFATACQLFQYQQFIFQEQWLALKAAANKRGIRLLGDIPIFVSYDSADVWAHQGLFRLNSKGQPEVVAGVPPDYFSVTGQLWGNPLYDWPKMVQDDFAWWRQRFRRALQATDIVRLDHFRGFHACWAIPAGDPTAVNGTWEKVPGDQLFTCLQKEFGKLPVIAEDLGIITPDVEQLRQDFGFPGMKILQFAFDSGPDNPYLPQNFTTDCVVYTGTHDNNTTLGWWQALSPEQQIPIADILGKTSPDMPWDLIKLALESRAALCILPCQDLLSLDDTARFNTPGTVQGNWSWRLRPGQLSAGILERLRRICQQSERCHSQKRESL